MQVVYSPLHPPVDSHLSVLSLSSVKSVLIPLASTYSANLGPSKYAVCLEKPYALLSTTLHNSFFHSFYLKWFCQMCGHAGCETSFCVFLKCICSHCNDRNCFCICPLHSTNRLCCCNTIHNRHKHKLFHWV